MNHPRTFAPWSVFGALLLALIASGASAGSLSDGISINGFGHQSWVKTDTNTYIVANSADGSVRDYVMGLTFTAKPSDRVYVRAQILHGPDGLNLDWGFGEYHFNDNVGFKAGKVKLPFGLYTQTMDVKALQPFAFLPGIYFYGVNSYNGFGLFGSHELENGWGGEVELYGGESPTAAGDGTLEDFVGGQVWVTPPVDGLKFGAGYWQMNLRVAGWPELPVSIVMPSLEYVGDKLFLRGEANIIKLDKEKESKSFYVEAGYMVHALIQPVARWTHAVDDNFDADLNTTTEDEDAIGIGINFFPAEGMVVKLENHFVTGNSSLEASQRNGWNLTPDDKWNLTALSVAFMF